MKRLLACLLLVMGMVGCGEIQQVAQQPSGESEPVVQKPSGDDEPVVQNPSGEDDQDASPGSGQSNDNLTICPDCEGRVSKRATTCPHCGAPLTEQVPPKPQTDRPTLVDAMRGNRVYTEINEQTSFLYWLQVEDGDQITLGGDSTSGPPFSYTTSFASRGNSLFTVGGKVSAVAEYRFHKTDLSPNDPFQFITYNPGVDLQTVLTSTDDSNVEAIIQMHVREIVRSPETIVSALADRYDIDEDGILSITEIEGIAEPYRSRLMLADADEDGAISKDELLKFLIDRYAKYDKELVQPQQSSTQPEVRDPKVAAPLTLADLPEDMEHRGMYYFRGGKTLGPARWVNKEQYKNILDRIADLAKRAENLQRKRLEEAQRMWAKTPPANYVVPYVVPYKTDEWYDTSPLGWFLSTWEWKTHRDGNGYSTREGLTITSMRFNGLIQKYTWNGRDPPNKVVFYWDNTGTKGQTEYGLDGARVVLENRVEGWRRYRVYSYDGLFNKSQEVNLY
jgi:hypothetical protein